MSAAAQVQALHHVPANVEDFVARGRAIADGVGHRLECVKHKLARAAPLRFNRTKC